MRELIDRRRPWLEAFGWGLSLIGILSFAHFLWLSVLRDGGSAYDLHAYLLAGRNLLDGTPLYGPMGSMTRARTAIRRRSRCWPSRLPRSRNRS